MKAYLVTAGIAAARLTAAGLGSTKPVARTTTVVRTRAEPEGGVGEGVAAWRSQRKIPRHGLPRIADLHGGARVAGLSDADTGADGTARAARPSARGFQRRSAVGGGRRIGSVHRRPRGRNRNDRAEGAGRKRSSRATAPGNSPARSISCRAGARSLVRAITEPGEVIELDREQLLALVQTDAELSEILMRAFILRRVELIAQRLRRRRAGRLDAFAATRCASRSS